MKTLILIALFGALCVVGSPSYAVGGWDAFGNYRHPSYRPTQPLIYPQRQRVYYYDPGVIPGLRPGTSSMDQSWNRERYYNRLQATWQHPMYWHPLTPRY